MVLSEATSPSQISYEVKN